MVPEDEKVNDIIIWTYTHNFQFSLAWLFSQSQLNQLAMKEVEMEWEVPSSGTGGITREGKYCLSASIE